MKPRVLFLDHTGSVGGAELFLLDVARHNTNSSSVALLTDGPFRERLERAGVEVEVLPAPEAVSGIAREGGLGRDLLAIPGVLGLARRVAGLVRGHDLLYANSQKALVVGALAGKLARKPAIWHLHDVLTADHFSQVHRWLATTLANRTVARVVANSKATAAAFEEGGGNHERVRIVYNGMDPAPFESVTVADVDILKRELDVVGVPVVGAFSRLAPWKGQHVLLEALVHLPGVHALLVGDASFGEEGYARALRERARTLGVADRAHFLGFREDIPRLMRLTDLVVHSATTPEPFGRMIVEGMLARRPVVASRAGGVTEIVEDGVSGILVPPERPRALASALANLLADPSRSRALAEEGYARALKRFSLHAMLEGVSRQIQEVVAPRP